jgi:hypothetical protein
MERIHMLSPGLMRASPPSLLDAEVTASISARPSPASTRARGVPSSLEVAPDAGLQPEERDLAESAPAHGNAALAQA